MVNGNKRFRNNNINFVLVKDSNGNLKLIQGDTRTKIILLLEQGINTPPELCKKIYGKYDRKIVTSIYTILKELENMDLIKRIKTKNGTIIEKKYKIVYPIIFDDLFFLIVVIALIHIILTLFIQAPWYIILMSISFYIATILILYTVHVLMKKSYNPS